MTGDMFLDGHCSVKAFPALNRASFAVAQVGPSGETVATLLGAVPRSYPQTAQAAEYFAAVYSMDLASGGCRCFDDCLNVVKDFQKPEEAWSDDKKAYSGVMVAARRWIHEGEATNFKNVEFIKVEAHVKEKRGVANLSEQELYLVNGSDLADKLAENAWGRPPFSPYPSSPLTLDP